MNIFNILLFYIQHSIKQLYFFIYIHVYSHIHIHIHHYSTSLVHHLIICQLSYHYYTFKYTFIFNTSSYPYYFIPIFYIYHHYIYEYNLYHYLDIIYSFHHFPFSIQISSKSTTWSYQPIYTYPFNCTSPMVSLGHIVTVYNNTRLYHHSFSLSTFLESLQGSCQFCHLKRQFMINFKRGVYESYHTIY